MQRQKKTHFYIDVHILTPNLFTLYQFKTAPLKHIPNSSHVLHEIMQPTVQLLNTIKTNIKQLHIKANTYTVLHHYQTLKTGTQFIPHDHSSIIPKTTLQIINNLHKHTY